MDYSLILGGTAGLGREIYKQVADRGPCIIVGRRDAERFSADDIFLKADFGVEEDVRKLIDDLNNLTQAVRISDFYWVSGVLRRCSSLRISAVEILNMVDVNLRHPLLIASWIWQYMHLSGAPSRYTIISSTVGVSEAPRDDEAVYAAVKAAQVSFARAIGKQNLDPAKQVSLFCPGGMKTEFWSNNPVERETYLSFLDPSQVAVKILAERDSQSVPYLELVIPRGSLS